jgi:hypothetical protein
VIATRAVYAEPNGTTFGMIETPILGRWTPVTAMLGPANGVGVVMLPVEPSMMVPSITPETLKVPFAVEGTYSDPFQVPLWTVPEASPRSAATM